MQLQSAKSQFTADLPASSLYVVLALFQHKRINTQMPFSKRQKEVSCSK
jgi:hypothetical protein